MSEPRRIDVPGVYDLTAEEYHADPCPEPSLSSGCLKALLNQSPVHAMAAHPRLALHPIRENKDSFDLGTAAHSMLLHEDRQLAVWSGDDWRTAKAKEFKAAAYERGATPLLEEQFDRTFEMVEACRLQLRDHEAHEAFVGGLAERSLFWREGDLWCRIKPDWMPLQPRNDMIVYDYKSTAASAHADAWGGRTMWGIGADIQDAFYSRGIEAVLGIRGVRFRFVVQENKPPYAINVIEVAPASRDLAKRKIMRGIEMWRQCLADDIWPGFANRVHYVEIPAWQETQFLAREAEEPVTPEMVRAMIEWQRPVGA